jgi:hypothetical protein
VPSHRRTRVRSNLTLALTLAMVASVLLVVVVGVQRGRHPMHAATTLTRGDRRIRMSVRSDGTACLLYGGSTACASRGKGLFSDGPVFAFALGRARYYPTVGDASSNGRHRFRVTTRAVAIVGIAERRAVLLEITDSTGRTRALKLSPGRPFVATGAILGNRHIARVRALDASGRVIWRQLRGVDETRIVRNVASADAQAGKPTMISLSGTSAGLRGVL